MTPQAETRAIVNRLAGEFAAAGIDTPRLDARAIVLSVLDRTHGLTPAAQTRIETLARRRAARRPMAQVLGVREFWSLEFAVTSDTLSPRPESELVVERALDHLAAGRPDPRVLDLGTGTGCLLLSVLHEISGAAGIGVDVGAAALRVAAENADRLGLAHRARFVRADWAAPLAGRFDAILANPPYVADADFAALEPEVRDHEPRLALAGGTDGLDCVRAFAPDLPALLAPGGIAIVECGAGQARAAAAILDVAGLTTRGIARDLAGVERCVLATN